MKLLLVSDIHLGVKSNSELFLENTKQFFLKQISQAITTHQIEQLWILGDLFDNRNNVNILVKNTALQIMATLLKEHPTLLIRLLIGNHDIYYKNTLAVTSLKIFLRFHKNIEVINQTKSYDLDGCKTIAVPWLIENSKNYTDFIEASQSKDYDLCLGHFEVNGFEVIKGVVEKKGLTQETFNNFKSVFSGHFHIRNKIGNVQYLGCPYEITWNDYGDDKGFTIFDTKTHIATFVQNNISPKHKKIVLSSLEADPSIISDVKHNFIKLIVDKVISTEDNVALLNKIEAEMPQKLDVINQADLVEEATSEGIDITEINTDTLTIIKDYIDANPLPPEVNVDEFTMYIRKLYDASMADGD